MSVLPSQEATYWNVEALFGWVTIPMIFEGIEIVWGSLYPPVTIKKLIPISNIPRLFCNIEEVGVLSILS
jgi:hypothetical protein